MAKFNASVSVDGNGILTLKLGKVFPEFQRGEDPNSYFYIFFMKPLLEKNLNYLASISDGARSAWNKRMKRLSPALYLRTTLRLLPEDKLPCKLMSKPTVREITLLGRL